MRLTKIKLAGFKSFVDPTTIPLIGNLSAVVGPNGCGKSNVIDAVRWVMGESSAKKLRGGELADVIFNGSSGRKPIGQASVELHFDNTEGALGGEFATYTEISIRRLVTRDGQSQYYINGTRCRRRDVKDIFLGTGLGPRSYAIIEQGMISKFIEAKPEDMRNFVEEAAGISKYKERRRETENRIKHTRENLERLTDLREELDKQLKHLQRQSEAAEKFKTLKEQERLLDAQLAALSWSRLDEEIQSKEHWIREIEIEVEKGQAERQSKETQLEAKRAEQVEANEALNEIQEKYYNIGNEIARVELSINHHEERKQTLVDDNHQATVELKEARANLWNDENCIANLKTQLETLAPELEQAKMACASYQEQLGEREFALETWQDDWSALQSELEKSTRDADIEKTKIAQLDKQIHQAKTREIKLVEELERLKSTDSDFDLQAAEQQIEVFVEKVETLDDLLSQSQSQKREKADELAELKKALNLKEKALTKDEARLTSLETLQQTLANEDDSQVQSWLSNQGLSDNKRIYQTIDVQPEWRNAVETVLGDALESIIVDKDQCSDIAHALVHLESGSVNFSLEGSGAQASALNFPRLVDKLNAPSTQLKGLLSGIFAIENIDEALSILPQLSAGESVITSQGLWLGPTWMRLKDTKSDPQQSILHRETEIKAIAVRVEQQNRDIEQTQEELVRLEQALNDVEAQREEYQFERNQAFKQMTEHKYTFQTQKDKLSHLTTRIDQIELETAEIRQNNASWQEEIDVARSLVSGAIESMSSLSAKKEELDSLRATLKEALAEAKEQAEEYKAKEHEIALQVNRYDTELNSTQSNISRFQNQIQNLEDRLHQIEKQQTDNDDPIEGLKEELESFAEHRLIAEESLNQSRDLVSGIDNDIREFERLRSELEKDVSTNTERLAQTKMKWQALSVHRETALEKLSNTEFALKDLLENMPEDADEDVWAQTLLKTNNQIQRLGAINLAAIDEYAQQNERKVYLDSQDTDLNEALKTLETAINKIDRESKNRFKETFDRINQNFQELFPRLFGGGHASLSLTSDDMLETGITVMARPPGKKNTTIHLLSGGEKALTAVSLVFSIFQLNPAPFCMLDEVDAPLDDYNVGRLCNLVKEMSKTLQFIYISHNKLALEMADQLQGVTMKEPGVSRIVTVDVEQAQSLAQA